MATELKAIETRYDGYLFRSRLEARWAVFFNTVQIPWRYEVEGFEFDDDRYLPDFWLPQHKIWVEIKPDVPSERELRLMDGLASARNEEGIILAGEPWPLRYTVHRFSRSLDRIPEIQDGTVYETGLVGIAQLARCRRCYGLCVIEDGDPLGVSGYWAWGDIGIHANKCNTEKTPIAFSEHDFKGAREARFEHLNP